MPERHPRIDSKYRRIAASLRMFGEEVYRPQMKALGTERWVLGSQTKLAKIFQTNSNVMGRAIDLLVTDGLFGVEERLTATKLPEKIIFVQPEREKVSAEMRTTKQSLQQWVAASILKDVRSGQHAPGSRIGSNEEFQSVYVVSRNTMRLGLGLLTDIVESRRRGTNERGGVYMKESLPPEEELDALAGRLGQTERKPLGVALTEKKREQPAFQPATLEKDKPLAPQIAEDLGRNIDAGVFENTLPTIVSLVSSYNVSRDTVRSAFAILISQNRIASHQGVGTIILRGDTPAQEAPTLRREQLRGEWVAAKLLEDIGTIYPPGGRLPAEPQLQEIFHAGRNAVRDAVQILVDHGILDKKAGKGTTVKDTVDERKLRTTAALVGPASPLPITEITPQPPKPSRETRVTAVAENLRSQILAGELPNGSLLKITEIAQDQSVAGATAVHALDMLVAERLLERKRGAHFVRVISPEIPAALPISSGEVLPFVRGLWKKYGNHEGWTAAIVHNADQLLEMYIASGDLPLPTGHQAALRNLARMLFWYGVCAKLPYNAIEPPFTQAAPLLLSDLQAIDSYPVDDPAKVILAHTPHTVHGVFADYLTNPFIPAGEIPAALTRDNPRSYLEEVMKSGGLTPEIPINPGEILTFIRLLWRSHKGTLVQSVAENEKAQQMLDVHTNSQTSLDGLQRNILLNLGRALAWYGPRTGIPDEALQQRFSQAAPLFLEELAQIQALGVYSPEIVIMRQNPATIHQLLADFEGDTIINRSDVLVAVRGDNFPRDRIETIRDNVVSLQSESTRGARRFLYAVKKAARSPEPDKMMADIENAYDQAQRKYGGSRFVSRSTLLEYCVSGISTWDRQIGEHVKRCNTIALQYQDIDEVTDKVIETYSRLHRDPDRTTIAIEDFRGRFANEWQRYQSHEDLDRNTFITISESFYNNIPYGVDLWLTRYPLLRDYQYKKFEAGLDSLSDLDSRAVQFVYHIGREEVTHMTQYDLEVGLGVGNLSEYAQAIVSRLFGNEYGEIIDTELLKDYVARTLRMSHGNISDLIKGFNNYTKLLRTALPEERSFTDDKTNKEVSVYYSSQIDTPDSSPRRTQLKDALRTLTYDELCAVQIVYGLEGLDSDFSSQEVTPPTMDELLHTFHTDDLERYVNTTILPKIRQS